jgi:hypothetical protein
MAQIVPGVIAGCPGGTGSAPLGFFYGSGSPAVSTNALIVNAQTGSLYSDFIAGNLWFKSIAGWQQVTLP